MSLGLRVAIGACILFVAGCGNDYGRGIKVFINNGLAETVVVTYEEPGHEMTVATLEAAGGAEFSRVVAERGPSCHGPFVARSAEGTELARADELCPGVVWTITEPPSRSPE